MRLLHVVGARPNFMKVAPTLRALRARHVPQVLVHTGQHYDPALSDVFFRQLEMPQPDVNLEVGSGSHAQQTAAIMQRLEPVLLEHRPSGVLVYGDVNSTVAAALVAAKLGLPVAHVEAGLRSFDRTMPEEINRVVTDRLSDLLFTPSEDADRNLANEGMPQGKIFRVGNVMIDTLVRLLPTIEQAAKQLPKKEFVLVTLHRPANVDDPVWLTAMLEMLSRTSDTIDVLFPVHPRTRESIKELPRSLAKGVQLLAPLPYIEFLAYEKSARLVITDSGGVQEETTYLGVPCITVRENTERPITTTLGTNRVVGRAVAAVEQAIRTVLESDARPHQIPPLWDGSTADRIAEILVSHLRS